MTEGTGNDSPRFCSWELGGSKNVNRLFVAKDRVGKHCAIVAHSVPVTHCGGNGQDDATEAGCLMGDEVDKCPICLNPLVPCDLAVLPTCCHVFCLRCILQWAEMVPSCPVDRRPFSTIYKWDALGYVMIPVKRKLNQTEIQACHFNKGAENGKERVLRREDEEKSDRMSHAQVTEHTGKKCLSGNDFKQDSSAMKNKKLMAEPCCHWSLDPCPAFPGLDSGNCVTLPPVLAELITAYEHESMVLHKRCHLEVWEGTRQPVATSITAEGFPWRPPSTREMSNAVSPLGFLFPDSSSELQQVGRWFAFQGKVCAITCAKGEEKATKTTGSKGLKSKPAPLPTRTTRNSRTRELSPAQDPGSLQSGNSDSNSSFSNPSPKAGSGSRTNRKQTGKRKPKQGPEEKKRFKGNTRPRRKNIQDSQSSPEDVGDEVQQDLEDEDGGEEDSDDAELGPRISDGEQVLTAESGESTQAYNTYDGPNTSYRCSEDDDEVENAENIIREDCSPDGGETEDQAQESQEEKDLERLSDDEAQSKPFRMDHTSDMDGDSKCLSNQDLANSSPSSTDQDEVNLESIPTNSVSSNADHAGDTEMHVAEDINEDIARAESVETGEESCDVQPNDLSGDQPNEDINKCTVVKKAGGDCIDIKGSDDCLSLTHTVEDEEGNKQSEDNMEMVPMDCDSPSNDHGELEAESEGRSDSVPMHTDSMASSQASEEDKKPHVQEDPEQNEQPVSRQRKSRFHSPSTTWSPKKESKREPEHSEAKARDSGSSLRDSKGEQRRSRSRDRDRDWDHNGTWSSRYRSRDGSRDRENGRESQKIDDYRRNRNRERTSRRRSRTRSRSRSRSRSLSRNRGYGRGSSSERAEPGGRSPRRRDRWAGDDRRNARESYNSRRHDQERPGNSSGTGTELHDNGALAETTFDQARGENPEWVKEKMANSSEDCSKNRGLNSSQWEDSCSNGAGDNWSRNAHQGGIAPEWRRGAGWSQRGSLQKGDVAQNRWQPRNSSFSGTSNNSGNDSYSRFNENRLNRRTVEQEHPEPPVDRSGWSSASNWAVCRTLPADVQNYYSRRGRGSGGWSRQDEEKPAQEATQGDPNAQGGGGPQVPLSVVHHLPMTVPAQAPAPPPTAAPLLPFPVGTHPQPLKLPPAPFTVPHQVPMFLHPSVPLLQVPLGVSQGVPPPPPPPPPIQQADSQTAQKAAGSSRSGASLPPHSTPKAVGGTAQGAAGAALPSSTTQPRSGDRHRAEMHADSSKKEKKLQIQEKAVHEVKMAIKPYYQNKDITKEEYKEIVRKAVEKVCHSKSGEVNSAKVANLVKAYVDKYKHGRKKSDELSKF